MRPRIGSAFVYRPVGYDLFDARTSLSPGDRVTVVRPAGCPAPGTMGHVHVNGPDGKFAGLVLVASLSPISHGGR